MTQAPEHLTSFNDWPIARSYEEQFRWLDDHVQVVPPMVPGFEAYGDVEQIIHDYPDEAELVYQRMQQLHDLMNLTVPVFKDDEWGYAVATRNCPCGMTNDDWHGWVEFREEDHDPMGTHHGRNV